MSQNYDFLTLNREFVSCSYEKKRQNCEIFFIQWQFSSVVFYNYHGDKNIYKNIKYMFKQTLNNLYKNV